jgi:hypothetical protein
MSPSEYRSTVRAPVMPSSLSARRRAPAPSPRTAAGRRPGARRTGSR